MSRVANKRDIFMIYFSFIVCCLLVAFAIISIPRAIECDFRNFRYIVTGEI